jgi:hypothetical protein
MEMCRAAHLLPVFAAHAGGVLAQVAVDDKTNEAKAALNLLELVPV